MEVVEVPEILHSMIFLTPPLWRIFLTQETIILFTETLTL